MSKAEIFELVSTISYILAGLFLILTIFLAYRFRIWSVIGDLTGRTAKKSIERLRKANEISGNKSYRPSTTNAERGTLTATITEAKDRRLIPDPPKKKEKKAPADPDAMPETGLLSDSRAISDTGHLQTGVLAEEGTTLLQTDETDLLATATLLEPRQKAAVPMTMLTEVILIHTNEVIA